MTCPKHIKSMGSSKAVIKDVRIFVNTINKAVDTMRLAGIDAKAVKSENNNYIEYTIKIPKKTEAIINPLKFTNKRVRKHPFHSYPSYLNPLGKQPYSVKNCTVVCVRINNFLPFRSSRRTAGCSATEKFC